MYTVHNFWSYYLQYVIFFALFSVSYIFVLKEDITYDLGYYKGEGR